MGTEGIMTTKQQCNELYQQGKTTREIAAELGVTMRSVQRHLKNADNKAHDLGKLSGGAQDAQQNIPVGQRLRGVSTMVDADGTPVLRWIKTAADTVDPAEVLAALRDEVDSWGDRYLRHDATPLSIEGQEDDTATVYPMGDPHIGMLAWRRETGEDFNLQIAERNLTTATQHLVSLAPASSVAHIIQLGDFFHANDQSNRTPASGHQLDADGRHAKVMRVGIRTMVSCIDSALAKHGTVYVHCLRGNHDPDMAVALALMLEYAYRHEPRVVVNESPAHYQCVEFGVNMIGMTHGDGAKAANVPGVFACDFPEVWGRTKIRHVYSGHVHHTAVQEYAGMVVESVRTLAVKDAWHAMRGYRSGRSMFADVWHRQRGPILRHTVGVEALKTLASD